MAETGRFEAEMTIFLDQDKVVDFADRNGMVLVAVAGGKANDSQ